MARAPIQILVLPYYRNERNEIEFAIFKRADEHYWQFIAGGAEDDETPIETAMRETFEEAGILPSDNLYELESFSTIPVTGVTGEQGFIWGEDVYLLPQYCFALEMLNKDIKISAEHTEYKWTCYNDAYELLNWQSNKNALWELNCKLSKNKIGSIHG
ncbi:MAG: NUDIX pyrophosphatase [Ignavibacteriae bacterium]|nr:MAG: NUDIX pyrophosphatase [Ignavibacteriota bacterium]